MVPVAELAAAAVAALAPYLSAGATEGAKKLGTAAAERLAGLYDKVKARLTSPLGQGALAAIERAPAKADAQAALRLALETELAENPAFHAELAGLVEELGRVSPGAVSQTSHITGDGNVSTQVAGSGNQVQVGGGFGKPS
jgi:hypothetical protein